MSNEDEIRRRHVDRERREERARSERARTSNDIGRWFHNGIAEIRGETRKNGWQQQRSVKLPSGRTRIHDGARTRKGHEFREYKNAQVVGGKFVMEQISKEREHLTTDPKAKGAWIVLEGSPDSAARAELERLEQDFKGRFQLIEISRDEARKALKQGRALERNRNQLELFDTDKLRAKERVRETKEKAQEKQRVQEAAQRATDQREQERKALEQQQKQREAADRLTQRAIDRREAANRGERTPMSAREAADVLRLGPPTPGMETTRREPPPVAPVVKSSRNRSLEQRRNLSRGIERDR